MVPDAMNILGIVSLVVLGCVCIVLTFRAWWDTRNNDLDSLKQHLRIIGVSQIVIIATSLAIGADMVAATRVTIHRSDVENHDRDDFRPSVFHASR